MKTKLMLLSLMLISTLSFSQTIIRVKSGEKIQNIIDDINTPAGSILLLDPGSYEGFTVYKRVSVIGSGFFNGINTSSIKGEVRFTNNTNSSSENSIMSGCDLENVDIRRSNITVTNCRMNTVNNGIYIADVNNCKISKCFLIGSIFLDGSVSNVSIQNNIILQNITIPNVTGRASGKIMYNSIGNDKDCNPFNYGTPINGIIISNNIFLSPVNCDNRNGNNNYQTSTFAKFNNNILRRGNYQSNDVSNKFITDMTTLFITTSTSPDAKYLLSTNSPAKGAGEGGTDCGAFGGSEPYIIGGLPIGPVITDLQVPSTARQNETIQIKLKAKVQN